MLDNGVTAITPRRTTIQYNTIQYKTYNAPYVTKMLFVGAGTNSCTVMCNSIKTRNPEIK